MGAPKVSRAILTMSTARTTPAQKPRGFSSKTRLPALSGAEVGTELSVEVFTPSVYRLEGWVNHHFDPNMVQLRNPYKPLRPHPNAALKRRVCSFGHILKRRPYGP